MTYDAAKANAKVLALMASAPAALAASKTVAALPCGCVVTQERGHTNTKLCLQHVTTKTTKENSAMEKEENTPDGAVPLEPEALLKNEERLVKKAAKKKAAKKKAAAPRKAAAPKKEAKRAAKVPGDGLGREGTIGRFICEAVVAGGDNKKVSEAASKKFGNKKITAGYVSWWRNKLRRTGVIKAAK